MELCWHKLVNKGWGVLLGEVIHLSMVVKKILRSIEEITLLMRLEMLKTKKKWMLDLETDRDRTIGG